MRQLTEGYKVVLFIGYVAGIYSCQLAAGVFEQRIYKVPYASNASPGTSALFTDNITPFSFTTGIAALIGYWLIKDEEINFNIPLKKLVKIAASDLLIHIALIAALFRTDYTTYIVVNSSSLLSVVLVGAFCSGVNHEASTNEERDDLPLSQRTEGRLLGNERIGREKIWICTIVLIGVAIFSYYQPAAAADHKAPGGAIITFLLFAIAILLQGFRPDFAAQVKQEYEPSPLFFYFSINALTAALTLLTSLCTWKLGYFIKFVLDHDRLLVDLTIYAVLHSLGSLFMYKLIAIFRQHIYPLVAEVRRYITICLNVIWYGHHLAAMQWFGIFIVFSGIMVEIISNYNLASKILPNDNTRSREGKNYNKVVLKEDGWSTRRYDIPAIGEEVEGI